MESLIFSFFFFQTELGPPPPGKEEAVHRYQRWKKKEIGPNLEGFTISDLSEESDGQREKS